MRRVLQRGATPAVLRLYDPTEAARTYSTGDRALLLVLAEGDGDIVYLTLELVAAVCDDAAHVDVATVGHGPAPSNDVAGFTALSPCSYVVVYTTRFAAGISQS